MGTTVRSVAALAAAVLLAGPAAASHTPAGEPFVPEYTEQAVYLHCNGATKVSNLHAVAESAVVTWDTKKPTTSFTTGGGCGTADTFLSGTSNRNPVYDFTTAGNFTGNLDNMTIRFWAIDASGSRVDNQFTVDLHVTIDGYDVLKRPTVAHAAAIPSSTGIARLYEVTVTGIGFDSEADHAAEHRVEITAYPKFANGSGVLAWVYDATEIDSGLVFNDKTPAAVRIAKNNTAPREEFSEEG